MQMASVGWLNTLTNLNSCQTLSCAKLFFKSLSIKLKLSHHSGYPVRVELLQECFDNALLSGSYSELSDSGFLFWSLLGWQSHKRGLAQRSAPGVSQLGAVQDAEWKAVLVEILRRAATQRKGHRTQTPLPETQSEHNGSQLEKAQDRQACVEWGCLGGIVSTKFDLFLAVQ